MRPGGAARRGYPEVPAAAPTLLPSVHGRDAGRSRRGQRAAPAGPRRPAGSTLPSVRSSRSGPGGAPRRRRDQRPTSSWPTSGCRPRTPTRASARRSFRPNPHLGRRRPVAARGCRGRARARRRRQHVARYLLKERVADVGHSRIRPRGGAPGRASSTRRSSTPSCGTASGSRPAPSPLGPRAGGARAHRHRGVQLGHRDRPARDLARRREAPTRSSPARPPRRRPHPPRVAAVLLYLGTAAPSRGRPPPARWCDARGHCGYRRASGRGIRRRQRATAAHLPGSTSSRSGLGHGARRAPARRRARTLVGDIVSLVSAASCPRRDVARLPAHRGGRGGRHRGELGAGAGHHVGEPVRHAHRLLAPPATRHRHRPPAPRTQVAVWAPSCSVASSSRSNAHPAYDAHPHQLRTIVIVAVVPRSSRSSSGLRDYVRAWASTRELEESAPAWPSRRWRPDLHRARPARRRPAAARDARRRPRPGDPAVRHRPRARGRSCTGCRGSRPPRGARPRARHLPAAAR